MSKKRKSDDLPPEVVEKAKQWAKEDAHRLFARRELEKRLAEADYTDKGLYERKTEPDWKEASKEDLGEFDRRESYKKFFSHFGSEHEGEPIPFLSKEEKLKMVRERHPLLAALENAETPEERKAAKGAILADGVAMDIQYHLTIFESVDNTSVLAALDAIPEEDWTLSDAKPPAICKTYQAISESSFLAGWHLAIAYLLAIAGETARHGKKMDYRKAAEAAKRKRAERGTRAKKLSPLKAAVLDAWKDYQEDNGADASPSAFVKWLYHDADIYDIEASRIDEEFRKAGESVKGETIRKNWLK